MTLTITHMARRSGGRDETGDPRSLPPIGRDPYCIFTAYKDGEFIGDMVLCQTKWGFWETHSDLLSEFRGQGYGVIMYDAAIKYAHDRGWRVSSSLTYTDMAENVWKSKRLRKRYRIRKQGKRYYATKTIDRSRSTPSRG